MKKTFTNILVFFYSFITIFGLIPLLNNNKNSLTENTSITTKSLEPKNNFKPTLFIATNITDTSATIEWSISGFNLGEFNYIDQVAISTKPKDNSLSGDLSKEENVYYSNDDSNSGSTTLYDLQPNTKYTFYFEVLIRHDNTFSPDVYTYYVSNPPLSFTTEFGEEVINFEASVLSNNTDVMVEWTTLYIKIDSITINSLNDSNIFYENHNSEISASGSIILKGFKPNSTDNLKIETLYYSEEDLEPQTLKSKIEVIELTFPKVRTGVQTFFMYLSIAIAILIMLLLLIFLTLFFLKKYKKENFVNDNYYEETSSYDYQNYSTYANNDSIESNYNDEQHNNYFDDEENLNYLDDEIIENDEYKENY